MQVGRDQILDSQFHTYISLIYTHKNFKTKEIFYFTVYTCEYSTQPTFNKKNQRGRINMVPLQIITLWAAAKH